MPFYREHVCAAGSPLELLQPETLRWKVMEPVNLLGKEKFSAVDIRLRVKGGGHVSQAYGAAHCTYVGLISHLQVLSPRLRSEACLSHYTLAPSLLRGLLSTLYQPSTSSLKSCHRFDALSVWLRSNPAGDCQGPGGLLPEMCAQACTVSAPWLIVYICLLLCTSLAKQGR